ncbi:hypothetical protein [Candidatus Nitrospira salsa]
MEVDTSPTANPFSATSISVRFSRTSGKTSTLEQPVATDTREQLTFARTQIQKLLKALQAVNTTLPSSHIRKSGATGTQAATIRSSSDLGLTTTAATAATFRSTEEINTTPTSFSPFGPSFTGSSTSLPTLGGIYDGDNGTDTLTFTVTRGGTIGSFILPPTLEARDSQNQVIATFSFGVGSADRVNTLDNGLELSLSAGALTANDTFTVDVLDSIGSAINPDNPFNGTRNDNPNFDDGLSVSAGSFEVNGHSITVAASDSLNDVLTKITQSSAGVTATFDAGTESVVLTQKTTGSAPTITVGNDTAGFLTATKLNGATAVQGQDEIIDEHQPLSELAQFSSVISGSILINSISISIDVLNDSINDVLSRINGSAANVTASFNESRQRISITANDPEDQLILDSNSTAFFASLEITDGTYDPVQNTAGVNKAQKGVSPKQTAEFVTLLREVGEALNPLFNNRKFSADPGPFLNTLRANLQSTVANIFDSDGPRFRSPFGIEFDFRPNSNKVLDFRLSGQNHNALTSTLRENPTRVNQLLFGSPSAQDDGLLESIAEVLEKAESELREKLEVTGNLVDIFI